MSVSSFEFQHSPGDERLPNLAPDSAELTGLPDVLKDLHPSVADVRAATMFVFGANTARPSQSLATEQEGLRTPTKLDTTLSLKNIREQELLAEEFYRRLQSRGGINDLGKTLSTQIQQSRDELIDQFYGRLQSVDNFAGIHLLDGVNVGTERKQAALTMTDFEQELFELVNDYRKKRGLGQLTFDPRIKLAASFNSEWQDSRGNSGHNTGIRGWEDPSRRLDNVGLNFAGENAAWNFDDPAGVLRAWIDSSGHRALLNKPGEFLVGISQIGSGTTMAYGYQT